MIKFKNKSIRQKLFIITSVVMFISAFIIYLVMYLILPSYYYKYKQKNIDNEVQSLVNKVKDVEFEASKKYIDAFANKNNVALTIQNQSGKIIYVSNIYVSVIHEGSTTEYIIVPDTEKFLNTNLGIPIKGYSSDYYNSIQKIQFKDTAFPLIITVSSALQPINEASDVILSLAPYILFVILGISAAGAYVYSKYISDPLLKINKTAKKMTELDFETRCIVDSENEIGEIAKSLNELSKTLKVTMDELEESNKKLKSDIEKEREIETKRRDFVATISHELKSPIATAKGQIEGMINNIGVFKDREKYLRRSYGTINNMEKLVNEILEISKLENYDFTPKVSEVNLSNLIKKIIHQEEFLRFSKKLELEEDIESDVIVSVDEKLILKALSNIINNALKYSPEGEKIIISLKVSDIEAVFKVINTGVSIDKSDINEIFKAFYRVEKSRNRGTGGSGLGLYIVSNIFSSHGIKYDLQSDNNKVEFTAIFHLQNIFASH